MKKLLKVILFSLSFIVAATVFAIMYLYRITNPIVSASPNLSSPNYFIAHASGSLCGYVYLNSKESLVNSLDNGYQYIEVDLDYTSDSVLVCVHDWEDFNKASIPGISWRDSALFLSVPTLKEFKQRKIYGKFTSLTLEDVINIKQDHPFTLVTDRISNPIALNRYLKKEQRHSIMVEAFSEQDYRILKADGYIPMLSLKLVKFSDCLFFAMNHLSEKNIDWIVVDYHSSFRGLRLLKRLLGIKIAAYTVNHPSLFIDHLDKEFDLVYTDNWNLKTQINNFQNHTTR